MPGRDTVSSFDQIYEATRKQVLVYITAKCGSTEDIQDIFQDTYMDLHAVLIKKGEGYIENPSAFTIELAKRRIYRHYSLRARVGNIIPFHRYDDDEDGAEQDFADESAEIECAFIEREHVAEIADYVKGKEETTRKIFYLYYYMDRTIAEISADLSINESTVKSKLYRLRAELRRLFGKGDDEL